MQIVNGKPAGGAVDDTALVFLGVFVVNLAIGLLLKWAAAHPGLDDRP